MNEDIGTCKLCLRNKVLVNSHIIPKFIFKWIKETSATGFLRVSQKENQRVQDGFKKKMLCEDCEAILNKFETEFANKLFYPYVENPKISIRYGSWLLKFVTSVTWRSLIFSKNAKSDPFTIEHLKNVELASEVWRKFLLGEVNHPGIYQQHLMPFDEIVGVENAELPSNINRYLLRVVEIDRITSKNQAFICVKIPHFMFLGAIVIKKKDWKDTFLHVHDGAFNVKNYKLPEYFVDYILKSCNKIKQFEGKISEKQKTRIGNDIENNLERFESSRTFKAMKSDILLKEK